MKYLKLFEELDWQDFEELEEFADDLFAKLGVDVVLTKHFKDRVNDWRENRKPIQYEELESFFIKAYKNAGQDIVKLPSDTEVVLRDHWSKLNSPIAIKDGNRERKMYMQTIMRKPNFGSSDDIITI